MVGKDGEGRNNEEVRKGERIREITVFPKLYGCERNDSSGKKERDWLYQRVHMRSGDRGDGEEILEKRVVAVLNYTQM